MYLDKNTSIRKTGIIFGYIISYLFFTTLWYFIFTITNRLPESWSYFYLIIITGFISLVGYGIKRLLK